MKHHKNAEKLADIIEAHPDCKFNIDNDGWYITIGDEEDPIADSGDYWFSGEWYSGSNEYGAGLAEALLILLNRKGFNLEVSPV